MELKTISWGLIAWSAASIIFFVLAYLIIRFMLRSPKK